MLKLIQEIDAKVAFVLAFIIGGIVTGLFLGIGILQRLDTIVNLLKELV